MATMMDSWKTLSDGRRLSLIVLSGLIVAMTIAAFYWLTSKDFAVLFNDMEPRDAARIVAELEQQKIDYRLDAGGTKILVPKPEVHQLRLKLMGADVPLTGGVGFEIFDDSDFGMTDFAQRINYQRALEGELTRTIMSLKEVKYARVHLVMPDKGLFRQQDSPPSASVTLFLKPQYSQIGLGEAQVAGIQRLVSSAVPNLSGEQVTVSDQAGMTLSRQVPAQAGLAAVSGRLQQKQAVEAYLAGKVRDVLSRSFGADQVMVSVDVALDFSEVKRTHENVVTPDDEGGSVLRRRETRLSPGAEDSSGGNVTTEVEYKLGRTIEQIVETPGEIVRLSVGVMVPADTDAQRRAEIRELVEMVVGVNPERGDAVAVYTMDTSAAVPSEPARASLSLGSSLSVPPSPAVAAPGLKQWLAQSPYLASGLAAMLLMLLLLVLSLSNRRQSVAVTPLTQAERDEALRKINVWLDRRSTNEPY